MKIVGIQRNKKYEFDDGRSTIGTVLFLSEVRDKVEGFATERVFISDSKIGDYRPELNDEVNILYNKFGKIDSIYKIK